MPFALFRETNKQIRNMNESQIIKVFMTKCDEAQKLALSHPTSKILRDKWRKWISACECLAEVLNENASK